MIRVVIIEDEKNAAELLQKMLHEIDPSILVAEKCHDLPDGIKAIKKHNPHLVFLDIELPMINGLQLLNFFNENEITFNIIFTTAYNNFAVQAFEMSAIDYILKPIQEEKLEAAVNKFREQVKENSFKKLAVLKDNLNTGIKKIIVPVSNGYEIIGLDDILYLQAEGSYTKIYLTNNTTLTISKNLKYFDETFISSNNFFRTHRSYIVNISTIKKIIRNGAAMLGLINKTQIPITNDKVEELISIINNKQKKV